MYGRRLYILQLCAFAWTAVHATCPVVPLIVPRSQGATANRELVGLTNHINIFDMEKFYGTFAVTPAYTRSFKEHELAQCLFGQSLTSCDCPSIVVSGSDVANRGSRDWLADYFLLPTDYKSTLSFAPRISNYVVDFYTYLGLDEWLCGLFLFAHAPIVHTRWDLNFCETIEQPGTAPYPIGYFTPNTTTIARSNLRDSVAEYMSECDAKEIGDGIVVEPLRCARMSCESQTDTALADIRFAVGWNFFQDEDYHLGLGLLSAAPTGTKIDGTFLFESIVGNAHHWEFGMLGWGHVVFWRSECEEKFLSGWIQANITHMFKTKQRRCFDLKCKPLSRYMLAEQMTTDVEQLLANTMADTTAGSTVPSHQFNKVFAPVANITAQDVDVSVAVQADIVALLSYTNCGLTWDFGYNFWARSCEKIEPNCECPPAVENESWALKGNAYVFGFTDQMFGTTPVDSPVALSATQSDATIHRGTNVATTIDMNLVAANRNPVIDNRQWATAGDDQMAEALLLNQPGGSQTNTSKNPVILSCSDIDFGGAQTKGLSHKVFTHFSYSWLDNEDWTPYLGFGGEVEFAQEDDNKCLTDTCNTNLCTTSSTTQSCFVCDDDCRHCALSQWAVWIKAGVSFN